MNSKTILVSILFVVLARTSFAATVEVTTSGTTFVPPDVTIAVGDSVHWTGLMAGFHTVAEVDDAVATSWNGGFHSAAGASDFTFMFNTPGDYFFICEPHVSLGMRGTVTVESGQVPTVSQWGLAVLALLILGSAGVIIVRRQGAPASK